jgi:hypothetical protein
VIFIEAIGAFIGPGIIGLFVGAVVLVLVLVLVLGCWFWGFPLGGRCVPS